MSKKYIKLYLPCIISSKQIASAAVTALIEQVETSSQVKESIVNALSEAVQNCIDYAYPKTMGEIQILGEILKNNILSISVKDKGVGIFDVNRAQESFFTTGEGHTGLGFNIMKFHMDEVKVMSTFGKGVTVSMTKQLG